MHDLFCKKISIGIVCFLCFSVLTVNAQINRKSNRNYLDFQSKDYYFGLSLGTNSSGYKINQSQFFINNDSIRIAEGANGPGFNIHFILNVKIGEYFDFRIMPGFSFAERNLEFTSVNDASAMRLRNFESVFADAPFLLRFKSAPYKDKRAYVVAGMKYSYDVQSNSQTRQANSLIKISPHDFNLEVGAGLQFFFPYFIFSPEIKYSRGLSNILIYDNNLIESRVIEQLRSSIFTISFHFEG
jgi:hypothetical protein